MRPIAKLAACVVLVAVTLPYITWWYNSSSTQFVTTTFNDVIGHVPLRKELKEFVDGLDGSFQPQIVEVTGGIYKASGFSFGHTIILDGPDGLVIIDTTESKLAGQSILTELRKFNQKPIRAFIYTHYHFDHIQGTEGFIEDKTNPPDIWAHHKLPLLKDSTLPVGARFYRGAVYQFGNQLGKSRVWPPNEIGATFQPALYPNRFIYNESQTVEIAGLELTLLSVPGETEDHLSVWYPAKQTLIIGDNLYKMFPNLYAVRGTGLRDTLQWVNSLHKLRRLQADIVIPSHGPPVTGRQEISDLLLKYASAMQFVHDQTVRLMNKHYHPDEIANMIQLPTALKSHPYLREQYGRIDWSSKGVYNRYVGWFSGDPVELLPLTPKERSRRMVEMIGTDKLLEEAELALSANEVQWALELSTHVYRVQPEHQRAQSVRLEALRLLAKEQLNPSARNFYLTSALDLKKGINWRLDSSAAIEKLAMEDLLNLLKGRVNAELAEGVNSTLFLDFEDVNTTFKLQILHSVLDVDKVLYHSRQNESDSELRIQTSETTWKRVFTQKTTLASAYSNGDIRVVGNLTDVRHFMSLFETGQPE